MGGLCGKENYRGCIYIGVFYVSIMKGSSLDMNNILGIIFLILSTISLSGYNVLARILTKDFSNIELSFLVYNMVALGRHALAGGLNELEE